MIFQSKVSAIISRENTFLTSPLCNTSIQTGVLRGIDKELNFKFFVVVVVVVCIISMVTGKPCFLASGFKYTWSCYIKDILDFFAYVFVKQL